jgi:ACR3 family arsenite efflux pump ArsB
MVSAVFQLVLVIVGYLLACAMAWALHELAHYAVHSVHAESVTVGFNRRGPYTDVVYAPTAPIYAIRLGSIAPTLLYGLVSVPILLYYLQSFPIPRFSLVEWSLVLTPLVILIAPTGSDLRGFLYAHRL